MGFAAFLASGACGLSDGSTLGDWRIPNIRELHSLVDFGRVAPALPDGHPFLNVQELVYWSSSTLAATPSTPSYVTAHSTDAWVVSFCRWRHHRLPEERRGLHLAGPRSEVDARVAWSFVSFGDRGLLISTPPAP